MSNNGGGPKAVVPFGPKLNGKSEAGDELDRAPSDFGRSAPGGRCF